MARRSKRRSEEKVPDPARSYERAKPEAEAGMGALENAPALPSDEPDRMEQPVKNRHPPRQINAEDVVDQRARSKPQEPDHSMLEEEPLGWDQAPQEAKSPRAKRHSRKEGKGGVP